MTEETKSSKEKELQRAMFIKFLRDASSFLGGDLSPLATHVKIKIEEASYIGGIVIMNREEMPASPANDANPGDQAPAAAVSPTDDVS